MGLRVIPEKSRSEGRDGVIVVASDCKDLAQAIEEVQSTEARDMAIRYAASELRPPLVKPAVTMVTPDYYAVDGRGNEILQPGETPVGYEARIPVAATA